MSIIVSCKCGKKYQISDEKAGKILRCWACKEVVYEPKRKTEPPLERNHFENEDSEGTDDSIRAVGSRWSSKSKSKAKQKNLSEKESRSRGPKPKRVLNKSELATRRLRFLAACIDSVVFAAIQIVLFLLLFDLKGLFGNLAISFADISAYSSQLDQVVFGSAAGYLLLNIYFLTTQGQTIGKMLMGIRIVDYESGQLISIFKLVGLRMLPIWVMQFYLSYLLVGLVDVLFIFTERQRCLHDYLAGTTVVETRFDD